MTAMRERSRRFFRGSPAVEIHRGGPRTLSAASRSRKSSRHIPLLLAQNEATLGEGTVAVTVAFILAIFGYVGLVTTVALSTRGVIPQGLWRVVVVIILAHVGMVWHFRYGWAFERSVRNGYFGFVIFHVALASIVASPFVRESWALRLIRVSFAIVTVGALGAAFRYDVVSIYRAPVILGALIGAISLWKGTRPRSSQ